MSVARLSNGQAVSLGRKLAEGAEGRIHELNGPSDQLVKLYHKPVDENRYRKLVAMIQLRTAELEAVAAWPHDLVHDEQRRCIGFLMPRVVGPGIIDKLSHPAEQRITFPTIDYAFLVHVSMNLMRAAASLHAAGCVIGDINESNIYIVHDGTVRLIDVDSFQITHNANVFRCNVGTPLYTPPELQGASFCDVTRTPSHDVFGLAVLVFQLLAQGCHPFAGVPRDGHGRSIEDAIREGLYAYSARLRDRVSPPPDRLALSSLGELEQLFERTFLGTHRPSAAEWMNALDRSRGKLRRCARNPRHSFLQAYGICPLCKLPRDPFPHTGKENGNPVDLGGLSVADLIRQAQRLSTIQPLSNRCREPHVSASERSVPEAPRRITPAPPPVPPLEQSSFAWIVGGFLIVLGFALCAESGGLGGGIIAVGCAVLALKSESAKDAKAAHAAEIALHAAKFEEDRNAALSAYEPYLKYAKECLQKLDGLEARARELDRVALATTQNLLHTISEICASLSQADHKLTSELQSADDAYRKQKLWEYLEAWTISKATIPDIGYSRKAILASFGIETAADVERHVVSRVPGFGKHLCERLLTWRRQLERAFAERGELKAPAEWLHSVRIRHDSEVASAASRLRGAISEYQAAYSNYDKKMADIAIELDRARKDARTAVVVARNA
jgi:DNA-binding helix-hairpin-helix protein with protein kinase domain